MPPAVNVILIVVTILAGSFWIGGYVTVIIVGRVSAAVLDGPARVNFFRRFGSVFYRVSGPALLVAYAAGWTLLARRPWSSELTWLATESAILLLLLIGGVAQARDLTRLRSLLSTQPDGQTLSETIHRRSRWATAARALIGIVTIGLVITVAMLLVGSASTAAVWTATP